MPWRIAHTAPPPLIVEWGPAMMGRSKRKCVFAAGWAMELREGGGGVHVGWSDTENGCVMMS